MSAQCWNACPPCAAEHAPRLRAQQSARSQGPSPGCEQPTHPPAPTVNLSDLEPLCPPDMILTLLQLPELLTLHCKASNPPCPLINNEPPEGVCMCVCVCVACRKQQSLPVWEPALWTDSPSSANPLNSQNKKGGVAKLEWSPAHS